MSYFNHAHGQCHLGNKGNQVENVPGTVGGSAGLDEGFITTAGIPTVELSQSGAQSLYDLGQGTFGFFDDQWQSVSDAGSLANCCPLVLASAAIKANDKQGPYHGGYQESAKSKKINPKYVREFYRVDPCTPQQNIIHIGNTNYTGTAAGAIEALNAGTLVGGTGYTDPSATGVATSVAPAGGTGLTVDYVTNGAGVITSVTVNNPGSGYNAGDVITIQDGNTDATIEVLTVSGAGNADCNPTFFCDETYYLRLEVKGSPALRFANHNLYQTFQADGGCCDGPTPTEVDSTLIMIQWAEQIVDDPYFKDFVQAIVFDEAGNPWFATAALATAAGWPASQVWANYTSPGVSATGSAGIRLLGAYVDTTFKDCTFVTSDFFEKEPIRIYASLVDLTGDPCVFEGLCVVEECPPLQGMGFGEQVVRDLIKSESYLQNFFADNLRIREITQGDQILGSIVRSQLYTRYFIQHSVPRYNNPTGVFNNDQYLLDITTNAPSASFETFVNTWLGNCGDECTQLVIHGCTPCAPAAIPTP